MNRLIYFGPPGTGKTTALLTRLEEHLKEGVPPDRIAFLTFTRRAREEALDRVFKTLNYAAKDLPYFRTIHSMAFRALNLRDGDVIAKRHLTAFGTAMGINFGHSGLSDLAAEGLSSSNKGDQLLALDNLSRLRGQPLKQVWKDARSEHDWTVVDHFARSYARYKKEAGLLDYTDVLTEFARSSIELPVDVAFIDEAQDLSALQWLAALQAVQRAATQYVAGDDDQAIYRWAGADVQMFIDLPGQRQVLDRSYRLPMAVYRASQSVIRRVKVRVPKEFAPREDEGLIKRHANADGLDVKEGGWLFLVRNRYLINGLRGSLENRGIVYQQHDMPSINPSERDAIYAWEHLRKGKHVPIAAARDLYQYLKTRTQLKHGSKLIPKVSDPDAVVTMEQLREQHGLLVDGPWFDVLLEIPIERRMYYRALLREHKTLRIAPQVRLETIHGAKGAEAKHVALFLEQSRRTWDEAQHMRDDEHRVFYVGATRAMESLHVIEAASQYGYQFPRKTAETTGG